VGAENHVTAPTRSSRSNPTERLGHVDPRRLTRRVNELTVAANGTTNPPRRPDARTAALGQLTARELTVLRLVAGGHAGLAPPC